MRLHCLGLSHRTAKVTIREQLAFSAQEIQAFWQTIKETGKANEMVVLSTCNRVEIYAISTEPIFDILENNLASITQIDNSPETSFYKLVDEQVVSHLFRVASGLDSMVLGEPQILGQVADAYKIGLDIDSCGKVLSKLFQMAIHTGKRVRTETEISRNSTSVSSLAAQIASKRTKNIHEAQIVFLGAGEMAELAVESLRKRGAKNFSVISRTISSACSLAKKWDGKAGTMETLDGALEAADILITSTSAPHALIHKNMIKQVMASRPERPLLIIDIAVPRDVVPNVAEVPGVTLYDIDTLNEGVSKSMQEREKEIPKVEQIISEEYQAFKEFYATLKVVPVIVKMRQRADGIRKKELEKTIRSMSNLDPKDEEQIAALTHSIVQKILHTPTIRLREEANGPNAEKYAFAAQYLFGLDASGQD